MNPKEVQSRLVVDTTMKTNTVDGVKGGKVVVVQGIEVNILTVGEVDDLAPARGVEMIGQVEDSVKGRKVVVVQRIEVNVLTVGEVGDRVRDLDPGQDQETDTEGIEIIGQVEDTVTKTQITAITTTREAVNFNLLA